uniref:NADH-ubiquinone oxidoreductase chain 3 n=1 Tax=Enicospilus sp. MD-2008 TaxID=576951 RepID=C4NCI7_9HYME|nr:NADH dehydrogenase subunit 3 [Enicospilus sp. MD-2008]
MLMLLLMMIFMMIIFFILLFFNFIFSPKKKMIREKNSPFECGFDPFNSSRLPFSIQFYMIGLIFLIFDIEIIIFFPFISSYIYNNFEINIFLIIFFIFILMLGLYLEWNDGALKWLK